MKILVNRSRSMNVLITGGTGFIGSQLARFLLEKGDKVTLFDIEPNLGLIGNIKDKVNVVRGDLGCLSDVLSAAKNHNAELIYHTGALLSARSEKYPVSAFRANLVGTFNVLEVARLLEVGTVMFASSIATFGEGVSKPVPNEAPQKPMTMYGVTTVASERLGEYYCRRLLMAGRRR